MKTLQSIFMALAATLVVASCDDESMNLDKVQVEKVISRSEVNVELTRIGYQLSWEQPDIFTQSGYSAFAGDNASLSYDVYLAPAYTTDTLVFIRTVDSCGVELSNEEVNAALDSISDYVQDFVFGVRLSGSDIPNNKVCYSAVQIVDNNAVSYYYKEYNRWFMEGARAKVNENNEVEIASKGNKDIWDVQFCNVFHCLKNQAQGKRFSLSFDIKWKTDDYSYTTPCLTIYTGKYVRAKGNTLGVDYDLQWNDANTQLIFKDGLLETMEQPYTVSNYWKTITLEGEIGEMGADIIAIQINLSGYEMNGTKHLNTDVTFTIKNVIVRIDDEIAAEYFCSYSKYFVDVKSNGGGDVSGGGIYMENETATLTATPNEGYDFLCWHDIDNDNYRYDNPLKITVEEDVNFVAEFAKVKVYYTNLKPLQYENTEFYFNKWFTSGQNSGPLEIVEDVAGEYSKAFAIEVDEAGDPWANEFCCILRGNKEQIEGNKFNMTFDVYWESASDNSNDTAEIRLLTGKSNGDNGRVHDDWQWSDDNTELVTDNAGGFWGYVHNQPREIPNKKWTHVSWGNELVIGEKGADYIGIQIDLNTTAGTNNGTFYFRNIEISMGNKKEYTIYKIDDSDY